jgi:hypothetical protein
MHRQASAYFGELLGIAQLRATPLLHVNKSPESLILEQRYLLSRPATLDFARYADEHVRAKPSQLLTHPFRHRHVQGPHRY